MQTEFMGLRPEGWAEAIKQAKLTRTRTRRRNWALVMSGFLAGVLVTIVVYAVVARIAGA